MMIGGHDTTISSFMNFLDRLQIIPRKQYPHYAFNIVIELRKYNHNFYLEFYYNDILKYNNTLEKFKSALDNSIYSNLYNHCGIPLSKLSLIKSINNESKVINQNKKKKINIFHIKNQSLQVSSKKNENKLNEVKNETTIIKYEKNLLKMPLNCLSQKDINLIIIRAFIVFGFLIGFVILLFIRKKITRKRYAKIKKNRDKHINFNSRVLISNES